MDEFGIAAGTRVGQLRAGDVVGAQQLDPKARLSRPVRALAISGTGTTGMAEVTYAPAAGGDVVSIKRSNQADVDLIARRVGALDEAGARQLMQPAARWTRLSQLPEAAEFVFKDHDAYRVARLTGAQTKTVYSGYRGRPTTRQVYTVQWDGGTRRDGADCDVLLYPQRHPDPARRCRAVTSTPSVALAPPPGPRQGGAGRRGCGPWRQRGSGCPRTST